jgi:urease accessory protein
MDIPTKAAGEQGWLPFILQTCDSTFPTGAYAHSLGLEEMVRMEQVSDEKSLFAFLHHHIIPSVIRMDLPLVREARRAALAGDLVDILEIDRIAGALRMARELREASLRIGRRRLSMMVRIHATPLLKAFYDIVLADSCRGHHGVVWGTACMGVPDSVALSAYFYQSISCFCVAAPKLMRMGQEVVQRVLTACLSETAVALDQAGKISRAEIGWFDPLLDIASMRHETANERLFIS